MEKLIILSSRANRGKTATLLKVINLLETRPSAVKTPLSPVDNMDVIMLISINGKKIGVNTGGDSAWAVKKGFDLFEQNGCDIIFCASCAQQGTVDFLAEKVREYRDSVEIIPYFKTLYPPQSNSEADEDSNNNLIARQLIKLAGL